MKKLWTDRSRIETAQRCSRRRWLEYHEAETGIVPRKKNIALAVGGSVHRGLEVLLGLGQRLMEIYQNEDQWKARLSVIEEDAVGMALADFSSYALAGLELDSTEASAMLNTEAQKQLDAQLRAQAEEMGMSAEGLGFNRDATMTTFERMLYEEQASLVEAMVRAYARRRLRPLLEQFEVLEVEREGEWKLTEWEQEELYNIQGLHLKPNSEMWELWFMSRPDALLRERTTNELYLLSYKTTGTWGDVRKAKSAEVDMQGLSEGVEVERRMKDWWEMLHIDLRDATHLYLDEIRKIPIGVREFLLSASSPPRIHAIRYEYLLKGERWEDKDLSAKLGMTVRTQRSHLIRQYVATSTPQKGNGGYAVGDVCWSWEYLRVEDEKDSKLGWQNWHSRPVWEQAIAHEGVKMWIDALDSSEPTYSGEDSTLGMEPRFLGYKSTAQAMGVTREHPLDAVFVPPVTVYRQDDQLRDWIEQVESQERRIAEAVAEVEAATDVGERHSLMNRHFVQSRHSCFYPTQCWATEICWGPNSETRENPLGSDKYGKRVPNHEAERKAQLAQERG